MEKEKNVNEDRRHLAGLQLNEFKDSIKNGNCPFCGKEMKWYDGCLGYEAHKCYDCKFTIDHSGMHLDDD